MRFALRVLGCVFFRFGFGLWIWGLRLCDIQCPLNIQYKISDNLFNNVKNKAVTGVKYEKQNNFFSNFSYHHINVFFFLEE